MAEEPQGMQEVIKVFVGCDPNDCDLEQMMVLDYSIRKHCSLPVEIHWMQLSRDPQSFWYSNPAQLPGWRGWSVSAVALAVVSLGFLVPVAQLLAWSWQSRAALPDGCHHRGSRKATASINRNGKRSSPIPRRASG